MLDAGMRLLRGFSTAIGEAPDFFGKFFVPATTALRLIHYPPAPTERPADLYGSHPHTDYGFLTILAQDSIGGLEVRKPDGDWMPVPYIPGRTSSMSAMCSRAGRTTSSTRRRIA